MAQVQRNTFIFVVQFAFLFLLFQAEAGPTSLAQRLVQGALLALVFASLIWGNYRYLIYPYLLPGRYGAYLIRIPLYLTAWLVIWLFCTAWTDGSARDLPTYLRHITSPNHYRSQWRAVVQIIALSDGTNIYPISIGHFIISTLFALVYAFFEIRARRKAIQRENRQAELAALRAQISPHFFFNALNTVYGQALTEENNKLADQLQKLAIRVREMNPPPVREFVTSLDERRTARLTAFLIAGGNFLYFTFLSFNHNYIFTQQTVWEFFWSRILANPSGAFFRSLVFALLTWTHYQFIYRPYFLTKRYFHYLAGLVFLLAVHWLLGLVQMFFSLYLHLHDFLNQGFERLNLQEWGLRPYATGPQIWESIWNRSRSGSFQVLIMFGAVYFLSGWLYQTINGLVENRKWQRQRQQAEQHQQAGAQNLTAQLEQLASASEPSTRSGAAQSLQQVTDLMAYVSRTGASELVRVADELQFLRAYIAFQRKRIPDHPSILIDYQIRYDEQPAQIASMLLIPFVENAFQYGIRTDGPCFVDLQLDVEKQRLSMTMLNSVVPKTVFHPSGGIGLANVRKRLDLLYPNQYTLTTDETDGVFRVVLTLQLSA
ncbi:histidine kinase [Larkinella insperata]|uniref:Histidine kinase n=1 Tax=Larkinella insperata TaxID=332158 RepID=A0ABW3QLP5_9BACT|nr:histidine kinase [Larkinella insperata]